MAVLDGATAGRIAESLGMLGLRSVLVFDSAEVVRAIDHQTCLVVLDERLIAGTDSDLVTAAAQANSAPVVLLTEAAGARPGFGRAQGPAGRPIQAPRDMPPAEIALQAARLLRRQRLGGPRSGSGTRLDAGDLVLDLAAHEVRWRGRALRTTLYQRRLLEALLRAEGAVVSEEQLARHMYGDSVADDGPRVRAHVKRLRRVLESADDSRPAPIERVRGAGYRLAPGKSPGPTPGQAP